MTLTVPKAGSDAGRAPQVRVAEPTGGEMFAQFGNQMKQVGEALETDFLQREAQRFQTDLTGDMNNLRLEVTAIGDPDAAEARWRDGTAALRQNYLAGQGENGLPRVSEKNRERFGLTFDELNNRNSFSLGRQTLEARQSQRQADLMRYSQIATQQAAGADPDMRATLLGQGIEKIDQLVATGAISPAQGETQKQALAQEMDNARAIGMSAENPQGMIDALDAGEFAGLPGEVQERYRVQAAANLDRAAAAAQTAAEKAAKEQATLTGNRLADIRDVRGTGMQSVDEAWLASDDAKSHPDYPMTIAALSLAREQPELAKMSPPQLDALIAGEEARPVREKYQTERVQHLRSLRKDAAPAWQQDAVAQADKVGLYVPDLPQFSLDTARDFGRGLVARSQMADELIEGEYTRDRALLNAEEKEQLRANASIDADPASRAALAETLTDSLSPEDAEQLGEIIGDPVFSFVGGLLAVGGDRATAREIFRGQQVVVEKNITLPAVAKRQGAAFKAIDAFFADQPDGEKTQSTITAAADALYAARIRREGPQHDIDTDVYRQALHEVMGGTGRYDGTNAQGGMQDVRGALTPLPMGVRANDADAALGQMARLIDGKRTVTYTRLADDLPLSTKITGILPPVDTVDGMAARARADALWQAASISGGAPGINGEPLDGDTLSAMQLTAVGNDEYQLTYNGLAAQDLVTGEKYTFRLSDLVRGNVR